MAKSEINERLAKELRKLSQKYNVVFVTATQCNREEGRIYFDLETQLPRDNRFIFVDHIDLIKKDLED